MFEQAILPDTLRAIKLVAAIPVIGDGYLAGGTALALQIGHRISVDLDFFTSKKFEPKTLDTQLKQYPEFVHEGVGWGTVWGKLGETKFSYFYYDYPLLFDTQDFLGIRLADKRDIAAMKVVAIGDRGTKRDFVDLWFLAQEYSVDKVLEFYDQKYHKLESNLYHIIRSLSWFEEADREKEMPQMLKPVDWEEVKTFFGSEAKRLAEERLLKR